MTIPFIKWQGGKRRYAKNIVEYAPKEFNRYIEPFLGGGAVFLELKPTKAILSDINPHLIDLWQVIQHDPVSLLKYIEDHKANNSKDYYISKQEPIPDNLHERAAWFYYMIQCGFNGRICQNKDGLYLQGYGNRNVPRNYKTLFFEAHKLLKAQISIQKKSYEELDYAKSDFVYMDPPYHKKTGYGYAFDQKRLKEFVDYLDRNGVFVLLSNSNIDFILDLYKDYKIDYLGVQYNIGIGMANKAKDVLIRNYPVKTLL